MILLLKVCVVNSDPTTAHRNCIHLAAKISVPRSITNPGDIIVVNIKGTFNVLEACSKVDVKNFIFASSSAVYGEPKAYLFLKNID
jgi:UDP-glucose 4-epimerase